MSKNKQSYKFSDNIVIYYNDYTRRDDSDKKRFTMSNSIKESHYNKTAYFVVFESCYYSIITPRIPEFEAIFPEFPYFREVYNSNKLELKIAETNDRIDKIVSHLEALIIGLGQRKASEESLDI